MVLRGRIENGKVVLDEPVALPEGASVEVSVLAAPVTDESDEGAPSIHDRLKGVVGAAKGLPPDAASNVDHYLYGRPKNENGLR